MIFQQGDIVTVCSEENEYVKRHLGIFYLVISREKRPSCYYLIPIGYDCTINEGANWIEPIIGNIDYFAQGWVEAYMKKVE